MNPLLEQGAHLQGVMLCMLQVRGPNYLRDKKKIPASDPLFSLAAVDLVECETGCFHIAQYLPSLKCALTLCP